MMSKSEILFSICMALILIGFSFAFIGGLEQNHINEIIGVSLVGTSFIIALIYGIFKENR